MQLIFEIIEHQQGIEQGCKKCRTILMKGNFAIGITVRLEAKTVEDGPRFKRLLGTPPRECCGETKTLIQTFTTLEEAEAEKDRVIQHIQGKGGVEGLHFLEWIIPSNN